MAEGSYLEKSGVDPAVFSAAGEQWRSANISFNGPVTNGAVLELAEIKAANPGQACRRRSSVVLPVRPTASTDGLLQHNYLERNQPCLYGTHGWLL